ncbi:uncharacterized protein LOC112147428 isoform X2 [Oryzias melastigma]|uniref:uncharacterized protein LOC112147428 isoform X2 n=1 Tax=Oryzias melastigma TaxID=30732 RepID=UPI000CF80D0E|nr:uncharacterized protein LOC112147428 isoform X2 [Oryzias melastigma]
MKLTWSLPVHLTSFLLLLASQSVSEENFPAICEEYGTDHFFVINSIGESDVFENKNAEHTVTCLLYQSDELNCSWSFHRSKKETEMSLSISVCNYEELVKSLAPKTVETTGSFSLIINSKNMEHVNLCFNVSLQNEWTIYYHSFEKRRLTVLPSPYVSALIKDGHLQISWEIPGMQHPEHCYDFQLDMGDQKPKNLTGKLSYTEPNADPSFTYRLRMRTKMSDLCAEYSPWSEWSPIFTLEKTNKISPQVIVLISLGIPMILLPVLLLLRHQRLSKLLFPPIPRPPQKYQSFLEKNDPPSFSCPAPPAKQEEEITEVEDVDPSSDNKNKNTLGQQ